MVRVADLDADVSSVLDELGVDGIIDRGDWADALCPLHEENNPSFSINLTHGGWVCRHGEIKGQLLDLVMLVKELTRRQAADWLRKQGKNTYTTLDILVDLYRSEPLDDREDILKWAKRYDETSSKRMSEYWFDRGFTHRTMLEFEVRYDEKYNCLIWPIRDEHSNLLGFARRYVPPSDNFKRYEYPRRFKRTLFPLDHLKGDRIILVEGPLDALWLHQHGYSESLAVLGSGLTQAQLGWLKGNARSVILLFDNDRDGRAGGERTAKQLSEIYTMFATLPNDVKDVQELEGERLAEMLENARPTFVR